MSVPNLSGWCAWFRDHRLFYSLGGKEFRTNGYYTLENECYNKEELIGGSIGTGAVYDDNSKFKWQGAQA
jgi:hypothetical protein